MILGYNFIICGGYKYDIIGITNNTKYFVNGNYVYLFPSFDKINDINVVIIDTYRNKVITKCISKFMRFNNGWTMVIEQKDKMDTYPVNMRINDENNKKFDENNENFSDINIVTFKKYSLVRFVIIYNDNDSETKQAVSRFYFYGKFIISFTNYAVLIIDNKIHKYPIFIGNIIFMEIKNGYMICRLYKNKDVYIIFINLINKKIVRKIPLILKDNAIISYNINKGDIIINDGTEIKIKTPIKKRLMLYSI